MHANRLSHHVDDARLRFRVKTWGLLSFLVLTASVALIFYEGPFLELNGHRAGVGQILWVPGLIGSCVCLWLLLTLSGAHSGLSVPLALGALAGAELCALFLPVSEVSGLYWEKGNGIVPDITFASLALTSVIWTATRLIDPSRTSRHTYTVALAAVLVIGFLLSYKFFWSLQGVMATGLAASLLWGMAYDPRLHPYGRKQKGRGQPGALLLMTFLGLPLLLLGLPYVLL